MVDTDQVAIVGAGIAGLALATALRRAGKPCRMYEQAPEFREVGAGIQLAPNATRLLHRIGLAGQLRRVALRPAAVEMRRWDDNRVLGRTVLGDECERRYGAPYYVLHRADLHRMLVGLLPPDVFQMGLRYLDAEETAGRVTLRFDDGSTAATTLLVGADGIRSTVRERLLADQPRFSGQSIYRGVIPADRLPFLRAEPRVILWLGPRQHLVCYPISSGRQVSFAATTPADGWYPESWSAAGSVADLIAAYRGWNSAASTVVAAAESVTRWALHDRDPVDTWSSRRVTLVGDAAHPMLPFLAQGANQAIEDAIVLADCLSGPDPAPLLRYETLRKERTARVQEISRRNAVRLHLDDGAEQFERDTALPESQRLQDQEWLYGYDARG